MRKVLVQAALSTGAVLLFCIGGVRAGTDTDLTGISRPSADILLAFTISGRVADLPVEAGEVVEEDDLLSAVDDAVERARLAGLKVKANSTAQIRAAEAEARQAEEDYKKVRWAHQKGAATDRELEHARLEKVLTRYRVEIKRQEKNLAGLERDEMAERIARRRLHAPTAGRIEEVKVEVGEAVEAQDPAVRLVVIDPLWVEAPLPLAMAHRVRVGDKLKIRFPNPPRAEITGRVVFLASVADAASETIDLRIELPNPRGRRAGERVVVMVPEKRPQMSNREQKQAIQTSARKNEPDRSGKAKGGGKTP